MSETTTSSASDGQGANEGTADSSSAQGQADNASSGSVEQGKQGGNNTLSNAEGDLAKQSGSTNAQDQLNWLKNKHKVKYNGQEIEVTAEEAFNNFAFRKANHEERNRIAAEKRRLEQIQARLKENPIGAVIENGLMTEDQAVEFALRFAQQRLEYEAMDPVKRQELELQRREQAFRKQQEAFQKQQQEVYVQNMARQFQGEFQKQFPQALQEAGLSPSERNVKKLAQMALEANQLGIEWSPRELAHVLKEDHSQFVQHAIGERREKWKELQDDQFLQDAEALLGPEVLQKAVSAYLARQQKFPTGKPTQQRQQAPQEQGRSTEERKQKFIRLEDLRNKLGGI
jgi:hypothetical protein